MAYSYTRQSSISDGDTITAALFNNEYNQLLNAFAYSSSDASATGHRHDGSSAQGGSIFRIGDLDFLNKIEADSTNNRWGFYVQVSSSAVEQIRVQDGAIVPVTDNDIDLGTSSLEFKDAYFDGTVTTDALVADTADINGGSVDGATIGAASASTIVGTTITANTAFVPDASDGAALGSASLEFSDLFLADGAVINLGDDQDTTLTHVADTGILLNSTRQFQFGDSGTYIHQSADGVLDLVSDTEIEINATTIDMNGNVDISGTLTVAGAVDFGDAALSNVGAVQLDSIAGDADSNTSITFSGSDVITIATGGTTALTIDASQNVTIAGDLTVTGDDITMGTNTAGNLLVADGTNFNSIAVGSLSEISTVANDDVLLAVDTSGGGLKKIERSTLVAGLATSSGISNIVEDTSPQLGGNLDTNSHNILVDDAHFIGDENGNEQIIFQTTSSAVNQFDITNAATGNSPKLSATGGDSNIDLDLEAKGTGHVTVRGNSNAGAIQLNCENNSHGQILQSQPHSASVTNTMLLPAGSSSTLVSLVSTDTLTNKTLTSPTLTTPKVVDSGYIAFGSDGEIRLISNPDKGLILKHTATADDKPVSLTLQTGETDIAANDVIGKLDFQAPDEGTGTDAILVAAGIEAVSEGDFSSSANATKLSFKTAASEAASEKMSLSSGGNLTVSGNVIAVDLDISGNVDIDGTTNLDAVDIDGAVQVDNTITVGVDDTGYDVKFFGATASAYMLWDASADDLILGGAAGLDVDGTTNLDAVDIDGAVQIDGATTFGVDDTGVDVKFFGATSGAYLLWDESADKLLTAGNTFIDIVKDKLMIGSTAVTTTAAELNKLDGVTATTAELNYLDITTLGTTEASKAVTADANGVVKFDNGIQEESTTVTSSSGAATLNLRDGTVFTHTLSEDVTYTFSNPAGSGYASFFTLKIAQDSSERSITWPGSVDWAAGTAPTISTGSGDVDVFVFLTVDGGSTYYGFTAGQDVS